MATAEEIAEVIDKVGTAAADSAAGSDDDAAFTNDVGVRTRSSRLQVDERSSSSSINSTNVVLRSTKAKRNLLADDSPLKVQTSF